MAREDPQLKIRLPDSLKERIENASKANGRSMNAEIAARLEESFGMGRTGVFRALDAHVLAIQNRVGMLGMQFEMARNRLETIQLRSQLISADAERLAKQAMTDEDFENAKVKADELQELQFELQAQRGEMNKLIVERESALEELGRLESIVQRTSAALETHVRDMGQPGEH